MAKRRTSPAKSAEVTEEIKAAETAKAEEKAEPVVENPKSKRGRPKKNANEKVTVEAVPAAEEQSITVAEAEPVEVTPVTEENSVPAESEVKPAEEKKSTAKKTTSKKSTTKKTAVKKTADKKTTTKKKTTASVAEETKPVEKKTTAKNNTSVNVFFQYQGTESAELIEKAKKLSGVKSPKSVNLYIKPEENMVYYVVDDIAGGFAL